MQRASGIPCALLIFEGESYMQTSGAMRRENAATYSVVIAREGGRPSIPETSMIEPKSRGVLDHPLSRMMTALGGAALSPSLRAKRSNPCLSERIDGLLRGACHRARIRATRWLAMTPRARRPDWSYRRAFATPSFPSS